MDIGSTTSVQGIQNAFAKNAARAKRIADGDGDDAQFTKDMAELPSDEDNVKANAQVIKTKDKMLGDLLDIKA